jgi:hypothetical protein
MSEIENSGESIQGANAAAVTTSAEAITGTGVEGSWFDKLPDDLKAEASLQNFKGKSEVDVIKSYVSAQKEIGARVRIPNPDASPEVKAEFFKKLEGVQGIVKLPDPNDKASVDAFYTKLGRPDKADAYKLDVPNELVDPVVTAQFKEVAHQLGLTQAQADALAKFDVARTQASIEAINAAGKKAEVTLKEVWGNEFDTKLKSAQELASHFSTKYPEDVKALTSSAAGNNPVFLMAMAELAKVYKESGAIKGEAVVSGFTPDEAREAIAAMRNNKAGDYYSSDSRKREAAVIKMNNLYKAANPGSDNA